MRRRAAIAFLALAIAGCDAQVSVAPAASPSGTSLASRAAPAYGVLVDLAGTSPTYGISLVGAGGSVPTTVRATRRAPIAGTTKHPVDLPYVSASLTTLYYLDGEVQVRAVSPGGVPRAVTTLAAGGSQWATFAVSPDDSRIAVSILDFSRQPVHVLLYTETLGGANHNVLFESDTNYVWPVAWHGGLLVLGHTIGPYVEDAVLLGPGRMNPYWAISYHIVNPQTADRVQLLGQCTVSGPLSPVGSACIQGEIIDWNGTTTNWGISNWGSVSSAGAISPEGGLVAATIPDQPTRLAFWRPDNTYSTWLDGPQGLLLSRLDRCPPRPGRKLVGPHLAGAGAHPFQRPAVGRVGHRQRLLRGSRANRRQLVSSARSRLG